MKIVAEHGEQFIPCINACKKISTKLGESVKLEFNGVILYVSREYTNKQYLHYYKHAHK